MPAEPVSTEATVTPMRVGASAGAAPLVLAVDDHSTNRNLLARQITALGLRAQTAEDGVEALAIWQEGAVALVVTDCNMPQMDGYALSRAIREIETNKGLPRTPIIAWTANVLPAAVALCRSAEMDDMLTKPAGLAALKETLSKWLPSAPIVAFAAENTADAELKPIPGAAIKLAALDQMATTAQERAEILLDFMIQTRNDAVGLRAAVAVQNLPYQVRIAHRMKGSSRMVGAQDLAAACEAIETAPGKRLPEGAMAAIDRALEQLEAHLLETTRVSGEQR
jgi:CheY-like chemotaxis protein/HPt (histidine-containing phosphotransfer) domain-containing protein